MAPSPAGEAVLTMRPDCCWRKIWEAKLNGAKRALEVNAVLAFPLVVTHLPDHLLLENACVIDQDIEAAKGIECCLDHVLCGFVVGNGIEIGQGFTAGLLDFSNDLLRRSTARLPLNASDARTNVVDDDFGAFGSEGHGFRAADTSTQLR